eukprot:5861498-Alexandrium_andersonii.AAC.1
MCSQPSGAAQQRKLRGPLAHTTKYAAVGAMHTRHIDSCEHLAPSQSKLVAQRFRESTLAMGRTAT